MSKTPQEMIEAFKYPPNHHYDLATMTPRGELQARLRAFDKVTPGLLTEGRRFLDVGCNKGFFTLRAAEHFEQVVGIDDKKYQDLWKELSRPNVEWVSELFQMYVPHKERFDKIFFGNVHYKLWMPSNSWDWVAKLATLSSGEVFIEGPVDNTEPLLAKLSIFDHPEFNFEGFMWHMGEHFTLTVKAPHPVIKGRWLMSFQRKLDAFDKKLQWEKVKARIDRKIVATPAGETYQLIDGLICKIRRWGKFSRDGQDLRSLDIARLSPISNGLEFLVYEGDSFVGWAEKPVRLGKYASQLEVFQAVCQHEIFLLRNGFFDVDPAYINFGVNEQGILQCFDKDGVIAFRDCPDHWKRLFFDQVMVRHFPKIVRNTEIMTLLVSAMETSDILKLEHAFSETLEILRR